MTRFFNRDALRPLPKEISVELSTALPGPAASLVGRSEENLKSGLLEELEDFFVGGDALVAEQLGPQTDLVFFDHQLAVDVDFELPDFAGD
ncbi:MAG: hypothetical protein KC910_22815 [Candidatus Eremiobacteraeota bacterium]|nr:hypothetical protein [Candidatus Eremiobacteraeota bacterium]